MRLTIDGNPSPVSTGVKLGVTPKFGALQTISSDTSAALD